MGDKSLEERVSLLEMRAENSETLLLEMSKTNKNIEKLAEKVSEMHPIVMDIVLVRGYGNLTWRVTKIVGSILLVLMTLGGQLKEHIKHVFHYIFG